jgi:hypothetical protein
MPLFLPIPFLNGLALTMMMPGFGAVATSVHRTTSAD